MSNLGPLCYACARYRGIKPDVGFTCEAYPTSIPVEIMASLWDHREPQEGDGGLRFEPKVASDMEFERSKIHLGPLLKRESRLAGVTRSELRGQHQPVANVVKDKMTPIATDPPVSEAQRRAMFAAAAGHSNLGIPKRVGEEFSSADPGGKLPSKAKDMETSDWRGLIRGLLKFFQEEAQEPEHARDATLPMYRGYDNVPAVSTAPNSSGVPMAAGVACTTKDGKVLLLKRSHEASDHANEWCLPGGWVERGEDAVGAARRELSEECGLGLDFLDGLDMRPIHRHVHDGVDYVMFATPVGPEFRATTPGQLSVESSDHMWADVANLPIDLHPGLRKGIDESFEKVEHSLAHKKGVRDPKALAAYIGREHGKIPAEDDWSPEAREAAAKARAEHTSHARTHGQQGTYLKGLVDRQHRAAGGHHLAASRAHQRASEAHRTQHPSAAQLSQKAHVMSQHAWRNDRSELGPHSKKNPTQGHDRRYPWAAYKPAHDTRFAMDWSGVVALSDGGRIGYAFDKDTVRKFDDDGRLHVSDANICKAQVDEYLGSEIPDAQTLGLDPQKKYRLYRDPVELKKAYKTFSGVPILSKHVPVDAVDSHPELVVGAVGDTDWEDPCIKAPLVFWPKKAIDEIESSKKKALSPGYKYTASMVPGRTPDGESYDGRMTNIVGNHLAQVVEGRQGPDVVVGDSALKNLHYGWRSPSWAR